MVDVTMLLLYTIYENNFTGEVENYEWQRIGYGSGRTLLVLIIYFPRIRWGGESLEEGWAGLDKQIDGLC